MLESHKILLSLIRGKMDAALPRINIVSGAALQGDNKSGVYIEWAKESDALKIELNEAMHLLRIIYKECDIEDPT